LAKSIGTAKIAIGRKDRIIVKKLVLNGLDVFLLPQKAIFIPAHSLLILSDWHVGKLGHFRKEGLFVPPMQLEEDFGRLAVLLEELPVNWVAFLGDLFHSSWNREGVALQQFLSRYPKIRFSLTRGNHDIIQDELWEASAIDCKEYILLPEGFVLSHKPLMGLKPPIYNLVGHIHPGCEVATTARQYFRFPCFYLEGRVLTLPAFGRWTGLYMIRKRADNSIFAVVGHEIIELK
jgi:DNA ligase-associated metallophosphoesterase